MMVEEPMLVDWSQNGIVEGWGWENEGRSANTKMCRMWGRLGLIEKKNWIYSCKWEKCDTL